MVTKSEQKQLKALREGKLEQIKDARGFTIKDYRKFAEADTKRVVETNHERQLAVQEIKRLRELLEASQRLARVLEDALETERRVGQLKIVKVERPQAPRIEGPLEVQISGPQGSGKLQLGEWLMRMFGGKVMVVESAERKPHDLRGIVPHKDGYCDYCGGTLAQSWKGALCESCERREMEKHDAALGRAPVARMEVPLPPRPAMQHMINRDHTGTLCGTNAIATAFEREVDCPACKRVMQGGVK